MTEQVWVQSHIIELTPRRGCHAVRLKDKFINDPVFHFITPYKLMKDGHPNLFYAQLRRYNDYVFWYLPELEERGFHSIFNKDYFERIDNV
jgi:hypothetical protein